MKFDTEKDGLETIVKPYQAVALRYMWRLEDGVGASSRDVWVNVNKDMRTDPSERDSISRASIINFMNLMVEEEALTFTEITGKGGHRRIYASVLNEAGFKRFVARKIISKLLDTWPVPTKEALKAI